MEENSKIYPSKKWYLLSIFLFFAGPLLAAYLLYSTFSAAIHTVSFHIPGTSTFTIPYPGEYSLWTSTDNFQISQQIPQDLSTIQLKFTDLGNGQYLIFVPKITWKDHRGKFYTFSLGTLRFSHAGNYEVKSYGTHALFYKIHLRQPSLLRIIKALVLAALSSLLGVVLGILSAIIVLIKRINARNMKTNEQKPIPTDNETGPATSWAMFCHLSGFSGFIFPLANIFVPLLIWAFKRHEFPYVDQQGKEAVNFQISITIYYLVSALLIFVIVGLFLLPILAAFHIIAMIIASIESAHAKPFKYPLTLRFLK